MSRTLTRRTTRIAGVGAALVLLVGALVACGSSGDGDDARTVTVVGTGEVSGVPDTLRATVGVQTRGDDVSAALNSANEAVTAVTDAVVAAGVDRADVQTEQVSLNPQQINPEPGTAPAVGGYEATNTLRLTIRDLDAASQILADAAEAGGDSTTINNVAFAIDDNTELLNQARESAFTNARERAEQYAGLADDSLGAVIRINESSDEGDQPMGVREMQADISEVPLEPGQQTVTFTVTVTFALT